MTEVKKLSDQQILISQLIKDYFQNVTIFVTFYETISDWQIKAEALLTIYDIDYKFTATSETITDQNEHHLHLTVQNLISRLERTLCKNVFVAKDYQDYFLLISGHLQHKKTS